MNTRTPRSSVQRRSGLSILEVIVSTMLVGIVLVGALRCAGGVITGRFGNGDSARAMLLAHDLMMEIMTKPYLDEGSSPVFGLEASELAPRINFDDVDDFHGWSSQPPMNDSGYSHSGFSSWQRDVAVEWVQPTNPTVVSGADLGVKRVTVTVSRNSEILRESYRFEPIGLSTNEYEPSKV